VKLNESPGPPSESRQRTKVPAGLLDVVVGWLVGLVEFDLAIVSQADEAAKILAVVSQDPKQPGDALVQVVVNFDWYDGLVQQDGGRPPNGSRYVSWGGKWAMILLFK
jgi:hypothetical protein